MPVSPPSSTLSSKMPLFSKGVFVLLFVLYGISLPLACIPGPMPLSVADVWQVLGVQLGFFSAEAVDPTALVVVGQIRLTRVVLALLCGGGLAVAGVALQAVLRNTLADPFTLGISAGAACGASLALTLTAPMAAAVTLFFQQWQLSSLTWLFDGGGLVSLAAFVGALLALFLALLLGTGGESGNVGGSGGQREGIILAGIAVSTFLGALVALIKALNEESVTSIVFWIMGSFQGRTWDAVPLLLWPLCVGFVLIAFHWRDLDVLLLGQRQAQELGVHVPRVRWCVLVGASLMAAGCVAVAGIIAFVGLVVPHILRFFLGARHGFLLVGAWFGGGLVLLWADVLARSVLSDGQELPVGVIMSLVGGPFFAFLVRARAKGMRISVKGTYVEKKAPEKNTMHQEKYENTDFRRAKGADNSPVLQVTKNSTKDVGAKV